jgi:hypothetical protein
MDPQDYAISRFSIALPARTEGGTCHTVFQVEQSSPFAAISSIFDQNQSANGDFAEARGISRSMQLRCTRDRADSNHQPNIYQVSVLTGGKRLARRVGAHSPLKTLIFDLPAGHRTAPNLLWRVHCTWR